MSMRPARRGGVDGALGVGDRLGERLLDEAVLAGLEHAHGEVGVGRDRRGEHDRVERGSASRSSSSPVSARAGTSRRSASRTSARASHSQASSAPGQGGEVAREVRAPVAEPDDADGDAAHRRSRLATTLGAMRRLTKPLRDRADRYLRARVGEGVSAALPPRGLGPLHGTYVGNDRVLVRTVWGGRLLLPADDLSLMPELVASGTYDVPFTAFVQREIKPGDTVVDVGANVGLFTLLLGYQVWEFGRVIAYEANPRQVELLRDNVSTNWLSDRIEIVPRAAGAESGTLTLLAPRRFGMLSSLQPVEHLLVTEDRRDTIDRIEVEVEPLDDRLSGHERIDLVKIDVEGAEERVFAGMERALASGAVRRVCFEMVRELLGADWEPFAARLHALGQDGWRFATIPDSGVPEPTTLDALIERGHFSQVLMTPATP